MKPIIIGTYQLGCENVRLRATGATGGTFWLCPSDNGTAMLEIGLDYARASSMLGVLHHEVYEFVLTRMHCRLDPSVAWNVGHDAYVFHFNHPQFTELVASAAHYIEECRKDLLKAHRSHQQKK